MGKALLRIVVEIQAFQPLGGGRVCKVEGDEQHEEIKCFLVQRREECIQFEAGGGSLGAGP